MEHMRKKPEKALMVSRASAAWSGEIKKWYRAVQTRTVIAANLAQSEPCGISVA
jgi:hypothetical protein